jgi:nucleoside 2-deoxyribosyltransferase
MERCPLCDRGPLLAYGQRAGTDMHQIRCQRCGEYYIDALAVHPITQRPFEERCYISALTRRASDAGHTIDVTEPDIQRLIDSAPRWTSPFEGLDRLLLLMASRAKRWVGPADIDKEVDYPLICARGPDEVNDLIHLGWQSNLLVPNKPIITVEGWRRVDALRERQPLSRQAFVAMSFAKDLDDAWVNGFQPGIEDTKFYTAVRVDRLEYNEKIDDRIVAEIRRSSLVVADFTGNRPGVYFEAGYALGLGLTVIWTCRQDCIDAVHFDTRQYNHIVWTTPAELRSRLSDRIAATALPRDWRAV